MNQPVVWIILAPTVVLTILFAYPEGFIELVDAGWALLLTIAHRWRAYLVQKYGKRAFVEFSRGFREKALKDGYEEKQIQEILEEIRPEVIEQLGGKYVDDVLDLKLDYE